MSIMSRTYTLNILLECFDFPTLPGRDRWRERAVWERDGVEHAGTGANVEKEGKRARWPLK